MVVALTAPDTCPYLLTDIVYVLLSSNKTHYNKNKISRTGRENGLNKLFPGDKSCSFSVETTKEIHVFEFVSSSPRYVALSPVVEVEVF